MMADLTSALGTAGMITAFVAVMMIAVEYVNVLSRGTLDAALRGSPWTQYLAAAFLGAIPGCLGAFTVVALYSHRVVTLGAVVASMIATSGDEAFVMLALFPGTALWLTAGLALLGAVVAPLVDRWAGAARFASHACSDLSVHGDECDCLPRKELVRQWRKPEPARVLLTAGTAGFTAWAITGAGPLPDTWNWVRVTLLIVAALGTFVVSTVPDHFLREHLWQHVVLRHVPRVFLWTAAVLAVIAWVGRVTDLNALVSGNAWTMLGVAALVGIVPESGPHLLFVTLFATGDLPLGVLVASSIVQDGHGMLPLLAQSPRDFLRVKAINLIIGLVVGAALLGLGVDVGRGIP